MVESRPLRIGTRGSPLALYQAETVRDQLAAAHPVEATPVIEVIRTTGDKVRDRALAEIGGKGLFTKEIEEALLSGAIDLAVHSMKDMPTWQPGGLAIVCQLERADPRDALLARHAESVAGLRQNAVIGSASLRRRSQMLMARPDLEMVLIRGNVETRMAKLDAGEVDGTLLAMAGLIRLGLADKAGAIALTPDEMLPAVAQGVICVECREADQSTRDRLAPLNHQPTETVTAAERAFLEVLDGSCRTPLVGFALLDGADDIHFRGLIARPDGSEHHRAERRGPADDARAMGMDAGNELKALAGPAFFDDG
ncbi:MAG: hydroxymethylbilane synthase [Alphaproteobacteria bacterium]